MTGKILCLVAALVLAACTPTQTSSPVESGVEQAEALGGGARRIGADYSRSPVHAVNGIAATAHPLASQVAIDILMQGGTAVDAAIAANATLGLMEPTGNGIGGDLFAIVWDPKSQRLYGYNGSGRSPAGMTLELLQSRIDGMIESGALREGYEGIPYGGSLPVTVPGTVDGWFALHGRFGKLTMSELMAPAVRYAREGHPLSPMVAEGFAANLRGFTRERAQIEEFDNALATYFPGGSAPVAGEIFRNPDLAKRLEGPADTTYLTVADRDGMMVSLIQSNYAGMGGGLVPDGLGFMLQDRGALFSLDPTHANAYAPGKRPFHTIIPAFVMKDGKPFMSFGLMGGAMQPQGHVQVLVNIIDFGMNLQEAGDTARFFHRGGRQATSVNKDLLGTLYVEPGVPAATIERLEAMGHRVEINDGGVIFGGYQAIAIDHELGSYTGATEMRNDGSVAAW